MLLTTRYFITVLLLSSCVSLCAQINDTTPTATENKTRFVSLDLSYNYGIPSSNFIYSYNLDNGNGANFNAQFYFKKYFYAGVGAGFTRYDTTGNDLLGAYEFTTRTDALLYAGVDYEFIKDVHAGVEAGLGLSTFNSKQNDLQGDRRFNDTGNYVFIGVPVDIKIDDILHILIRPRYDFVNLDIVAPQEVQSDFNRARFLNLNIGLRFVIE